VRDYRQIMVLANRHDWLSGFANELGVVLSVEAMLGMEVPERATWTRTLLSELTRVMSHLVFLGSYPLELGAITPIFFAFREREELQAVLEEATGGRMHLMFNQVGGLKADLPAGWLGRVDAAIKAVKRRLPELESLLVGNEIVHARTKGVGVLTPEMIAAYGVSGPIARASGVDMDLRRDEPYLAYGELFAAGGPGRVVTRTDGDALARLECLFEQVHVSLDLAEHCLATLGSSPQGPVNVKLPKILKVPEGHRYTQTENRWASTATTSYRGAKRPRGASSCARRPSTTSLCWRPCCRAISCRTWCPSWARCSSSWETSTSSREPKPVNTSR
jgi:NADH-quinone oxidoreductase subunit D